MNLFPPHPRYEVGRQLGAGAFGVVFEIFDRDKSKRVAAKVLKDVAPARIFRFKQEFRALAQVGHPNLVDLYELSVVQDRWFFTMELIEGQNFLQWVWRPQDEPPPTRRSDTTADPPPDLDMSHFSLTLPREDVSPTSSIKCDISRLRQALAQLVDGVDALHQAGWLHRDLKPSNVLVADDGRVVVLDFGLVTETDRGDGRESLDLVGTPSYMAPEQAASEPLGPAADWYAVGVMLYEALTGDLPFSGEPTQVLQLKQYMTPRPPGTRVTGVPPDLDALCMALLSRNPGERPNGAALKKQLAGKQWRLTPPSDVELSPFVGRQSLLADLHRAFEDTLHNQGVIVHVCGPSGAGKSTLVRHFLQELQARERDLVVLSGRCYLDESVPYKAVDSLVDRLSQYLRHLPPAEAAAVVPTNVYALATLFPVLLRVEAVSGARRRVQVKVDPHELKSRAFSALRELLSRLSAQHPLVLFIDDLQWGDSDSAQLLEELFRPPDPPSLLLITCIRSEDLATSPLPMAMMAASDRVKTAARVCTLQVGELDPASAESLARTLLGDAAILLPERLTAVTREAAGNPFLIDVLARYARTSAGGQTLTGRFPRSVGLDEVVRTRLVELPPDAQQLLEVVAVSGRPLLRVVARKVAGLADDHYALSLLRKDHWLRETGTDKVETYHDRIRVTMLELIPRERKRDLHLRLAQALEESDADAESLAYHYLGGGERSRAARELARGAEAAAATLAYALANRLYRRALELHPVEDETTQHLREQLALSLAGEGRAHESAMTALQAARDLPGDTGLALRRLAADQLLRSGHLDEGIRVLRVVLQQAGLRWPQTPTRAVLAAIPWLVWYLIRGIPPVKEATSPPSTRALHQLEVCWSAVVGLFTVDLSRGWYFQMSYLRRALQEGDPARLSMALGLHALSEEAIRRPLFRQNPEHLLVRARSLAERSGDAHAIGFVTLMEGMLNFQQGRWRSSAQACQKAEEHLRSSCTGVSWEISNAVRIRCVGLGQLGRLPELGQLVPRAVEDALDRGDLYAAASLGCMPCAILPWLARDEAAEGARWLQLLMARWSEKGVHLQHAYEVISLGITDLYQGDAPAANRRVDKIWASLNTSLVLFYHNVRLDLWALKGAAALIGLHHQKSDAGLRQAVATAARQLHQPGRPWTVPISQLLQAGLAYIAGKKDEKVMALLTAAEQNFTTADMPLHAAAARWQRGIWLGGEAGRSLENDAIQQFTLQQVKAPARMVAALVPVVIPLPPG